MPYAPHLRVTIEGQVRPTGGATLERFALGFSLGQPDGDPTDLGTDAAWNSITAAISTWFTSSGARIRPDAELQRAKMSLIGPDGRVVKNAQGAFVQRVFDWTGTLPRGTGSGAAHPLQVSYAISMQSPNRSRGGRGRMYVPCVAATLDTTYRLSIADANGARDAAATLLNAVNTASGPENRVIVASSLGVNHPVTVVRVGRVLDTQRRRRNQQQEEYVETALL